MYFHENQLVYPVQQKQDRDFQYGYNQILSSLGTYLIYARTMLIYNIRLIGA